MVVSMMKERFSKYCVDRKKRIDNLKSMLSNGEPSSAEKKSPAPAAPPVGGRKKRTYRKKKRCVSLRIPKRYTKSWRKKKPTRKKRRAKSKSTRRR